jgi:hypothetical protein
MTVDLLDSAPLFDGDLVGLLLHYWDYFKTFFILKFEICLLTLYAHPFQPIQQLDEKYLVLDEHLLKLLTPFWQWILPPQVQMILSFRVYREKLVK